MSDEDFDTLREDLVKQAQEWGKTEQGRAALQNTANYATFRTIALGKLPKDALRRAFDAEQQRSNEERQRLATDSPSQASTQARGRDNGKAMDPVDAFIKACNEAGVNPYKPLA